MIKKPGTILLLGAVGLMSVVILYSIAGTSASASPQEIAAAAHFGAMSAVTGADAEYVGSAKCKKCHIAEHKSWEKTPHGKALDALKPDNATERKTKAK